MTILEKKCSEKTKRCGIERFLDYFNVYGSIFHESHKSYWLIKYLNPKLISWDSIDTC
jgi:hypothetical protein